MEFRTQYKGSLGTKEKNLEPDMVERAGYISAQKRIENLIDAGHRLQEYRSSAFDFPSEQEAKANGNPYDKTRSRGYDMADAFQDRLAVKSRLKNQKFEAEQKASKIASEAEIKASNDKKDPE